MNETCVWTEDEDGSWWTECEQGFVFADGGPDANRFAYCPYCGKTPVERAADFEEPETAEGEEGG